MPTSTFFNLNDSKRERIIKAVKKEFTRKRLLDMSVKNIVEDAGIARGSFYQYFVSKEDLIEYMIKLDYLNGISIVKNLLEKNKGDLFKSSYDYLVLGLDLTEDETRYTINVTEYLKSYAIHQIKKINVSVLEEYIDMKKLDINSSEELNAALRLIIILISITRITILSKFVTYEEGIKSFNIQMNMLKKGLERKE